MKKFIFKIFFLLLCITILLYFNSYRFSYYEGVSLFKAKLDNYNLKSKKHSFNTIFFGSSHTYRQVDVKLFDKVNNKNNLQTTSYNFGIPACFTFEQMYLLENFLKTEKNIKNVFIELQMPRSVNGANMFNKRAHYFLNYKNILPINSILDKLKFNYIDRINLNCAFFLNIFNYRNTLYTVNQGTFQIRAHGYHYYIRDPKNLKLENRAKQFDLNSKAITQNLKNNYISKISKKEILILDYIDEVLKEFKDVNLYIYCHPFTYVEIKNKKYKNFTIFTVSKKQSAHLLSDKKYMFDATHLSKFGAEYYTNIMAEQFKKHSTAQEK